MAQKLLNYEIVSKLGEGAGSTIYCVIDPATSKIFALKHVRRIREKDVRFVEQMKAEYEVGKQFTHPNLRKSYELKINKSFLGRVKEAFMVLEHVEGLALDVRPPTTLMEIVDTFIQTARGLKALHQLGYVHCDIKPNNILRDDAGHVKVIDFGQAAKIGLVKDRIQGTPDFIAPEQVTRKPLVVQTDVYNMGATLYFALTRKPIPTLYTVSKNKKTTNSFLVDARVETPSQVNPKIPAVLSNLVMECVQLKQERRPSDMDSVVNRLELAKHTLEKQAAPAGGRAIAMKSKEQ